MKDFLDKIKSFSGFIASASVLIPGFAFFFKYSPPLIGGFAILVSALSAALVWIGFRKAIKKARSNNIAFRYMISGLVLVVFYWIMLDLTSIHLTLKNEEIRYQVGFNLEPWSLEDGAIKNIKAKICPKDTKENLFLCYTASRENVFLIWKRWTVYLFGIINSTIFTVASLLWCYGWGIFIKTVK
ncbi:MAG: hypothetical protein WC615_11805 [Mucilaginibacter sp.]|jgi:hypothetical protein|uniref:hypothetical protein n=1 Tax=Mucilaginibacter sp. TaxID=1882438 RepID=UPI0035625F4B